MTARATSSGVPTRPTRMLSITAWRLALPGGWPRSKSSLATGPGTTALTVMPSRPNSTAAVCVMPMTPAFALE